jgi:hypothetical protein
MLPAEDLFACVYVLIDDLVAAGIIAIPPRPGPAPGCSDAELLAIAQVRHLLGRRSEAGFLAEVARDWSHLFPRLPHQSEANRRIRWLWGRPSSCAATWPGRSRPMTASRSIPARCRSGTPRGFAAPMRGPGRMGCMPGSAATPRTPNGSTASDWRSRRTWAAASSAPGPSCPPPSTSATWPTTCWRPACRPGDLLLDKGFSGKAFAAGQAGQRRRRAPPSRKGQRHRMLPILRKIIAEWRNRIETTFCEITDQMELARHGAHIFWGLLTRTAAIIAAHTLMRVCVAGQ